VLHQMMQEFRESAIREQKTADLSEQGEQFYFSIFNYFGAYAEDKDGAIKYRDNRLFPAINEGRVILVDFDGVNSAPHSFLSALFASPIKSLGIHAYKKLKFVNAAPEIRETLDFILDENTE